MASGERGRGSGVLGDPGGWRARAAERGIALQLYSNHFGAWIARGEGEGETGHSASYDLFAHVDLGTLAGACSR